MEEDTEFKAKVGLVLSDMNKYFSEDDWFNFGASMARLFMLLSIPQKTTKLVDTAETEPEGGWN